MSLMSMEEWTKPNKIDEVVERYINCPKDIKHIVEEWTRKNKSWKNSK